MRQEQAIPDASAAAADRPSSVLLHNDSAIAEIRSKTEGLPVAHVYLWASVGGMDDDLVERHLDLVATRVVPALHGDAT